MQGYQLILWKNSILLDFLEDSPSGSIKSGIANSILSKPWTQFTSYAEMTQILTGHENTIAFEIENAPVDGVSALMGFQDAWDYPASLAMRKGLGLKEALDREIIKMRQEGLTESMREKWFGRGGLSDPNQSDARAIELSDIQLLGGLLILGIVLSIILSILEKFKKK